ncbi:diguanylate cyclase domain-containing protein [Kineococcus arenarius]|uniref:diguanylate cyclase domain-containing protein n=1 Tax=Kineococcus sp. SYSU DK007 TaxID=3383128 RepID=UPI003D7CA4E2
MVTLRRTDRLVTPVGEPAVLARRPWLRWALFTALTALAVLVGSAAKFSSTVPVLSPVPAVAVLWLAGSPGPRRRALDGCTLVVVAALVLHATEPAPLASLLRALAIALQGLASAWAYRLLRPAGLELRTARDLLVLAAGTGPGAAASVPLALAASAVAGPLTAATAPQWLLHGSVSAFVVVAAVLQAGGGPAGERRHASTPERCGVLAAFALTYALTFWVLPDLAASFALLPVAVWAALRESLRAVTAHLVLLATGVVVAVRAEHHPWRELPLDVEVVLAEAFLGVLALTTLALALSRADGERSARRAQEQADLLTAVFSSSSDAVAVVDARGNLLLRNAAADGLFGALDVPGMAGPGSEHGFFRCDGTRFAHEDLPIVRALRGHDVDAVEGRLVTPAHPAGRTVSVSARPLAVAPGAPWSGGAVAALHDVTEVRAAADEVARAHDLFESVLDAATEHAIVACDPHGTITVFNEGAERMLGWSEREVLGRPVLYLHDPAGLQEVADQLGVRGPADFFTGDVGGRPMTFRTRYRHRDGGLVPVSVTSAAMTDGGRVTGYTTLATDITAQLAAEERLTHQALHDALTGLPNRTLLEERLEGAVTRAARDGGCVGVLYLDLDGFKAVNDTAGHEAGDALLRRVAQLLSGCVRPGDTVARLGGDEFAVLCPGPVREADLVAVGERFLDRLRSPVRLRTTGASLDAVVGASIGVSTGDGASTVRALLHEADTAMYGAKRAGKGRVRVHGRARGRAGGPAPAVDGGRVHGR